MPVKCFISRFVAAFLITIASIQVQAQDAVNDFRSTGDGAWTTLATWQRCSVAGNPGTWIAAASYPGNAFVPGKITIRQNHDITLNTTPAFNLTSLVMAQATSLTVTAGSITLTGDINAAQDNVDVNFGGTGNLTSRDIFCGTNGSTFTFSSSGTFAARNVDVPFDFGTPTLAISGGTTNLSGTLSIGSLAVCTLSTAGNVTIAGVTSVAFLGQITDSNNTGVTTFIGQLQVAGLGFFTTTAVTTDGRMIFRGGIDNDGFVTSGSGQFEINTQSLLGSGDISFANNITTRAITLTNSNTGALTVAGTTGLFTSGGYTDNNASGTARFTGLVTVPGGTTFNTTTSTAVANLDFRGGISNGGTFTGGGATFSTNDQTVNTSTALSFANNVAVANVLLSVDGNGTFGISGTTTLTGNSANDGFKDINDNGSSITTFGGNVNVGANTTFTTTNTATGNLIFQGGITNNGTFNATSATFSTRNQVVDGGSVINFTNTVTVTTFNVTNNNTTSVTMTNVNTGALTGATGATWTQGVNSTLNYSGATITIPNFTASANNNTVNYTATSGGQTIFNPTTSTYYNLTLSGTGNITKSLSANTIALGDITIANTAIFNLVPAVTNYTLSVAGDWTNSSTNADPLVEGTGAITFNSTAASQTISNTGDPNGTSFGALVLNNQFATAPQLIINANSVAKSSLTMTDGVVNLVSPATFTIGTAAGTPGTLNHAGGSGNGWFYGGVLRRFVNIGAIGAGGLAGYFPVGSATDFRPFGFSGTVGTGGLVTIQHVNAAGGSDVSFADGASTVVKRDALNWLVTSTIATAADATLLNIRAEGTGFGTVGNVADLRITHVNDATNMGTAGTNAGSTTNPQVNRSALRGSQLAGTYYIGSVDANNSPLPIELVSFVAILNEEEVLLNWRTASEINNDFFTVERAVNLEKFESIGTIPGNGTTRQTHDYALIDNTPLFGRSYYRLKQTDFDGKSTYSKVVTIQYEGPQFPGMRAYPNPSQGENVQLLITGLKDTQQVPIRIVSTTGQVVFNNVFSVDTPGTLQVEISSRYFLNQGVYIVRAGKTMQLTQKLIIE